MPTFIYSYFETSGVNFINMFTRGFFVWKTKKLLVFENEFHHAFENYKNFENFYKIVRVAIRKLPLALVCPCFGQKKSSELFCTQLIATCEKAERKHVYMLSIFSTPVLIRHLWQLEIAVLLHWCLVCAVVLVWFQILALRIWLLIGTSVIPYPLF